MQLTRAVPGLEFEVARSVARRDLGPEDIARLAHLLKSPALDWKALRDVAHRHGLLPLLCWHLCENAPAEQVPASVGEALRAQFVANVGRMLKATAELFELLAALEARGVLGVPYKGPVLAHEVYGNLALRDPHDLDVVVRPGDRSGAAEVLTDLGYESRQQLTPEARRFLRHARYSEQFVRPGALPVELHWRFTHRGMAFPLDLDTLDGRMNRTVLKGREVLHFAPEDLLIVLSVHGAKHRWARLEWISGLGELVRSADSLDWEAALDRAGRVGGERAVLLGLFLAHRYTAAPVPSPLLERARRDREIPRLARTVDGLLREDSYIPESSEPSGSLRYDLFHFRLKRGAADRARYLFYRLTTPSRVDEWRTVRLGGRTVPLHPLVRPWVVAARLLPAAWRELCERRNGGAAPAGAGRPRRILQLVQKPQRRGAEVFAYELSAELRRRGFEVATLYLYDFEGEKALPLHGEDRCLGGDEEHPFERVPGFHPGLLGRLRDAISEYRPDVVQVNGARTVKYGAAAKGLAGREQRWKLVYRNIGLPSHWHSSRHKLEAYRRAIMPRIDGVVGVTRLSLEDAVRLYRLEQPTMVIDNGVDPDKLRCEQERDLIRRRLGVSPDDVVLLYLGSLSEEKRPDRFLRTVARVREDVPRVRAWIVGDGPLRQETERRVRESGLAGCCRLLGFQELVTPYLMAADLLLITSDSEGMPAVVLEAGYLGLPVVARRVGGLPETVADGETGFLVDGGAEALAEATLGLIRDPSLRERMAEEAARRVRSRYTIDRIADRYLEFYERVVRNGAPVTA